MLTTKFSLVSSVLNIKSITPNVMSYFKHTPLNLLKVGTYLLINVYNT